MFPGRQYRFEEITEALWRRRWLVIIPLWIVIVATMTVTASLPDRYESEVRIRLMPPRVSEAYVRSAVRSRLDERLPAITAQVLDVQRLHQVATEFGLYRHTATAAAGDAVSLMRQDIRVQIQPPDTIRVSYTSSNAATTKAVAERLGALFVNENRRQSDKAAAQTTDFLDAQLESARRSLETHDRQLEEYRRQHSGALPSQLDSNLEMLRSAQIQLQTIRESIDRDRNEVLMVDRLIADPETSPAAATTPRAGEARGDEPARSDDTILQQLQAASGELASLESRLKPAHPDVMRLKRRIADLESQLAAESAAGASGPVSSQTDAPLLRRDPRRAQLRLQRERLDRQISGKQAEERRLQAQINSYQRRIESTPARETQLTALMRDYDTLKEVYTKLLARKEEAKISASLQEDEIGEQFVIIEPAKLPTQPASPNRLQLNLIGGVLGLLLGIGLAALVEYRDTSARTERDILSGFGLPVLAAIPVMTSTVERRWIRIRQVAWCLAGLCGAGATTMWLRHFVR